MHTINTFLNGAIVLAALAIAFFFFRFRRSTGDRLFAFFSAAFVLLAVERIGIAFAVQEDQSNLYFIRLCAFALIVFGILDKNRKERKG